MKQVISVPIAELTPHPASIQVYTGTEQQARDLAVTMKEKGQLEPIIINKNKVILSGNLRCMAAKLIGWEYINAIEMDCTEEEEGLLVVYHNQQRKKSNAVILREMTVVLAGLQKKQGQRTDLLQSTLGNIDFSKVGKDRFEKAAAIVGNVSASHLRRLDGIVKFDLSLPEDKRLGLVDKVIANEISPAKAESIIRGYKEQQKAREEDQNNRIRLKSTIRDCPYTIYNASSDNMHHVGTETVQTIVTSPPYFRMRTYDLPDQLGHEESADEFIERLAKHFADVKRVLKNEGSAFINIADSIQNGAFQMIPGKLILKLAAKYGLHLINEIIWYKTNGVPRDNRRLCPSYEKIYHLVKDPLNYYYNEYRIWGEDKPLELIQAPAGRTMHGQSSPTHLMLTKGYTKFRDFLYDQKVHDVIISNNASLRQMHLRRLNQKVDHAALMTECIPVIPILTTSKPGDIVLDPFSGSGTTGRVALMLGRRYVGYELNSQYANLSRQDLNSVLVDLTTDEVSKAA